MKLIAFLFAMFYAIILTSLLVTLSGGRKEWKGYWPFFVLILLVALAAGLWSIPVGPKFREYYWLPGFLTTLIFALLIVAIIPGKKNEKQEEDIGERTDIEKNSTPTTYYSPHAAEPQKGIYQGDDRIGNIALSGVFWIIIVLLTIIIIAGIAIDTLVAR